MFRKITTACLLATVCVVSWTTPSEAHLRDYLFNQSYYTAKRGEIEVETYNDVTMHEVDNSDKYSTKHQLELEYGVTDHLQAALYTVWKWNKGQEYVYDQWKAEVKYRFFDAGTLPVDLALYTEYINQNGSGPDDSDKMEWKAIASKNWGRWNVTANWIMEKTIQNANKTEFSWTAGVNYAWTPRWKAGLEWKETLGTADGFGFHHRNYKVQLMPTIGWSPTPKSKILIGPAFGLSSAAPELEFRSLIAVEF